MFAGLARTRSISALLHRHANVGLALRDRCLSNECRLSWRWQAGLRLGERARRLGTVGASWRGSAGVCAQSWGARLQSGVDSARTCALRQRRTGPWRLRTLSVAPGHPAGGKRADDRWGSRSGGPPPFLPCPTSPSRPAGELDAAARRAIRLIPPRSRLAARWVWFPAGAADRSGEGGDLPLLNPVLAGWPLPRRCWANALSSHRYRGGNHHRPAGILAWQAFARRGGPGGRKERGCWMSGGRLSVGLEASRWGRAGLLSAPGRAESGRAARRPSWLRPPARPRNAPHEIMPALGDDLGFPLRRLVIVPGAG